MTESWVPSTAPSFAVWNIISLTLESFSNSRPFSFRRHAETSRRLQCHPRSCPVIQRSRSSALVEPVRFNSCADQVGRPVHHCSHSQAACAAGQETSCSLAKTRNLRPSGRRSFATAAACHPGRVEGRPGVARGAFCQPGVQGRAVHLLRGIAQSNHDPSS